MDLIKYNFDVSDFGPLQKVFVITHADIKYLFISFK